MTVKLPDGYSFTRTAFGEFAVRAEGPPVLARVRICGDGTVNVCNAPLAAVEAAIEEWRSLPPELQGCVTKDGK